MTTITIDTDWRHLGAVPYPVWKKKITQAGGSPNFADQRVWAAYGDDSALALAQSNRESSYASNYNKIPERYRDPLNLQVAGKGVDFSKGGSVDPIDAYVAGAAEWKRRLYSPDYKNGVYTKTKTIYEMVSAFAPESDGNDPLGYSKAMAAELNANGFDPPVTVPPGEDPEPIPPGEGEPMTTPQYLDYSSLSFPVEVRFIPAGQTMQRPGTPMQPTRTTWHDTGNPGARTNAESHAGWMAAGCPDGNGNPTYTSWHFTVDDGKAIQHIPLNEVAWHAGDGANGPGNLTSIAIEECVNADRDAAKTRANAAELHAFLIKTLNLQSGTVNGCVQHNYWSGKNCPEVIRNAGLWPEMQRQMTARLGSIPTTPVYADAAPVAKGSAVINGCGFLAAGGKTVQADVVPVKYADKDQPATGPALKKGTKLTQDQIGHYVVGTDGALWVELVDVPGVKSGSRIPAIALISEAA